MDIEIKHAPGHTIQAVDALSRIPSQNKMMAKHLNCAELKCPLHEELVLNAPPDLHPPSISDLLNEMREYEGVGDEVTQQHLHHMWDGRAQNEARIQADMESDDDDDHDITG